MRLLRLFSVLSFLVTFGGGLALAITLHVPADYPTIQGAINAAVPGDSVLVEPGTYTEHINFLGKDIVVGSLYMIDGDSLHIPATIIYSSGIGSGVTMANGETVAAVLIGFTITNGMGQPHQIGSCSFYVGGGVFLYGVSGTIIHNYIEANHAPDGGSGVFIDEGSPVIKWNKIRDNFTYGAGCGGGILCMNATGGMIDSNYVQYNTAHSGGGVALKHTSILVRRNVICNNEATSEGGGVRIYTLSSPQLINNTIAYNETLPGAGGGIMIEDSSTPVIMNNIISHTVQGMGIVIWGISTPQLSYNLFHANTGGNYGFWVTPGTGDTTGDPVYVGYGGGGSEFDYHLTDSTSAAFNAGNPDAAYNDPDLTVNDCGAFWLRGYGLGAPIVLAGFYGSVTPQGVMLNWNTASEINCYGWAVQRRQGEAAYLTLNSALIPGYGSSTEPHNYSYTDVSAQVGQTYDYRLLQIDLDGTLSYSSVIQVNVSSAEISKVSIQKNYPNPFNPQTTIVYYLPQASWMRLDVFDTSGRLVQELRSGNQEAGQHAVVWNAEGIPSGTYLCRLETPQQVSTKMLVLVK